MSRCLVLVLCAATIVACDDNGGGGPGVTSSVEHLEAPLPFGNNLCFTQPLRDVLPSTPGTQYQCTALLDDEVIPECGSNEPCWAIVMVTDGGASCLGPSVRGGNDGQFLSIDCVVEE